MQKHTLQILRYLALPCLFSGVTLIADEQGNASKKSEEMTFFQTYDMVKTKEVTPYAGPVVKGDVGFYIDASYILWHANQGGLQYAYNGNIDPAIAVVAISSQINSKVLVESSLSNYLQPEGRLIAPNFKTSSGFKVGMGLDFAYDGWDLGLNYTWLQTHAKSSVSGTDVSGELYAVHNEGFELQSSLTDLEWAQLNSGATATSTGMLLFSGLDKASSSWRLHFNVLDLELGRNFFISSKLLIRPHYGFKGTWQKQNNLTMYLAQGLLIATEVENFNFQANHNGKGFSKITNSNPDITIGTGVVDEVYQVVSHQNYWGIGPRAGMNLSWLTTRNFSVFTDAAVSVLWGQFKSTRRDYINSLKVNLTGTEVLQDFSAYAIRSRTHQVNVVVEAEMGLRYDYWFSNDEYRFRAEAGWENQVWFNQNQLLYHVNDNSSGDLTLQGFTLTFQFDF
jgi:hypothetical protein